MDSNAVPVEIQTLENYLVDLARRKNFTLLSPFADRHGFAEIRFIRVRKNEPITECITVGCDFQSDSEGAWIREGDWHCSFIAGAYSGQVSKRISLGNVNLQDDPSKSRHRSRAPELSGRFTDAVSKAVELANSIGAEIRGKSKSMPGGRGAGEIEAAKLQGRVFHEDSPEYTEAALPHP
jgi:hypothetical protein